MLQLKKTAMSRNHLLIIILILLFGCNPCDDSITIDNGKIPEKVLKYVPYQNGQIYKFKHSAGLIIEFTTIRQSRDEYSWCEECCKYNYKYEVNSTTLTPDYPIFDFGFEISNLDTTYYSFIARVGKYQFYIPTSANSSEYYEFADSILINDKLYFDVFKLKSNYGSYYDKDSLFADSLYYNYELGIIKIKMSNGEKYEIYE